MIFGDLFSNGALKVSPLYLWKIPFAEAFLCLCAIYYKNNSIV